MLYGSMAIINILFLLLLGPSLEMSDSDVDPRDERVKTHPTWAIYHSEALETWLDQMLEIRRVNLSTNDHL